MSVETGQVGATRVSVDDPDAIIAAWSLTLPDGQTLLAVNEDIEVLPGGLHYVESWYRLNVVTRGRGFAVLLRAEIEDVGHLFAAYAHVATTN